ncbi:DNA polymerase IV [Escherichia coli]|nr:DNA polymerase IV [Escherichia coli]EEX3102205.1 DNA polymerase IV [Escherichia coli]
MRKTGNRRERGAKTTIVRRQIKKNHAGHHGGAWKVAFADFTLAMMALFMTLWIVNSVSKSERESIIAALHGQSIFNGGGLSPLNKISPSHPPKPATVAVPEETEKKARDVNEKTALLKKKSATELGELQLTASAGVAPVKFLAKIASDMNKPNGQFVITPAEVPAFLQTLPLAKIPGVGKVSAAKLEAMGLRTCGDVQKCDLVMLLKRFGKFGRILWERSQGIDERDVNSERLRKSVGVERTMAEDIHHWSECEAIIERLYPELERRLAKVKPDLLIARQGVKLKFDDFQQTTQEHVWPRLNKADLIATARKTWDERRGGRGVRLVGLHVTLLDPQMERQLVLGL